MAKPGKRTRAIIESVDADKAYTITEAVALVKSNAKAKFDETVEIAVNLGVDPKYADQMVRGVVNLPSGTGKDVRVAVFAKDAKSGSVEFRVEKAGIIHAGIGKSSFSEGDIETNVKAFLDALTKARPSGAKGQFVRKITLSSTMGAGVTIDTAEANQTA